MPDLTFVIPVSPEHTDIAQRAINSVEAQTIPCQLVVFVDHQRKGAGFARNRGLESVKTPFVSFLDADDKVEPQFAEFTLRIMGLVDSSNYIYTNWLTRDGERVAFAPCDMWRRIEFKEKPLNIPEFELEQERGIWFHKTWHPVTTLIPTSAAARIGGFDENMTGLEDTDFYQRLALSKICGVHLNAALFHYLEGGQRSINAVRSGQAALIAQYMTNRYKEYPMGCCGDNKPTNTQPGNEPLPGDVLAAAIYAGNRQEWGLISGRLYPRTGNGKLLYMDERDINAAPHMWRKATDTQQAQGVILRPQYQPQSNWQSAATAAYGGGQQVAVQQQASSPIEYKPLQNTRTQQDVLSKVKGGK